MIKSLLLATSFVIGSGAGTLQNNAPAFHHYQITQETGTTTNTITIQSNNITNRNGSYEFTDFENPYNENPVAYFQYGHGTETNSNINNVRIDISQEYQYWDGKDDNTGEMIFDYEQDIYSETYLYPYYHAFYIIKITPYINITETTFNIAFYMPLYIARNQEIYNDDQTNPTKVFESYQNNYFKSYTTTQNIDYLMSNSRISSTFQYSPFSTIQKTQTGLAENDGNFKTTQDINITQNINTTPYGAYDYVFVNMDWRQQITYSGNEVKYYLFSIGTNFTWEPYDIYTQTETNADPWSNTGSNFTADGEITLLKNQSPSPTPTDYEVVDIGGLMFDILTMPFAFVSQAFNLTLFPDTPYEIHIATLFLAVFAALTFIFIIKKFIKK